MNGLLLSIMLLATVSAAAAPADTLVTYRDEAGRTLTSRAGAKYLVKTLLADSLGGNEWVYDLDGLLHERIRLSNIEKRTRHGVQEEYYPHSHQLKISQTYENGKLTGELLCYYPTGQLKRRERYQDYVSQGGQCFSETGAPLTFVPYLVMPEYTGGISQLISYLQQEMQYPASERLAGHGGRVLVRFIVEKDGRVTHSTVIKPLTPKLDAEALRVVRRMPNWKPGMVDGEIQRVSFTLPVAFVLQ